MCLFSFVIPMHNVSTVYLEECIESILANNSENIEIIVVDDCSTNGCAKLCDLYANKDSRIRVLHLDNNVGVSKARNIGSLKCAGEWIIFVDSDDWIDTKTCAVLSSIVEDEVDIIIFSAYRESIKKTYPFGTSEEKIVYLRSKNIDADKQDIRELTNNLLRQCLKTSDPRYETIKYCWGKAFRRQFLLSNTIEFPADINYCEDIVYMADAFSKADKVIQIPDRLYHYRTSGSSVVNSFRRDALSEQRHFLSTIREKKQLGNSNSYYYAAFLSMQICITRFFFNRKRKGSLIRKHIETKKFFSEDPYSEVFKYIDFEAMKKSDQIKAHLIKNRLYSLYYIMTEMKKKKLISYK